MADALDLESSGKPCKFESYYPHHKTAGLLLAVFIFIYDLGCFIFAFSVKLWGVRLNNEN